MNARTTPEGAATFSVRCGSVRDGCGLVAAASAAIAVEGVKALNARRMLDLPEPRVAGRPLSAFVSADLRDERQMLAFAAIIGRRCGIGAYWLACDPLRAGHVLHESDTAAMESFFKTMEDKHVGA